MRLGTSGSGDPPDILYGYGEVVPESGLYSLSCHGAGGVDKVALVRRQVFPECELCGRRAQYRLTRTAPYIFDDPDFAG